MAEELSVVGKRLPRKNARAVVTGKLQFYSDYMVPGQLYMSITRSQRAHARILSVDKSKAEALPGVRGVITHEDVPDIPISYPDFVKILNDKVFYHGCEVAAVAADTLEIAEEAAGLIEVEYQDLEVVLDPEDAIKSSAPEVHDGTPNLLFGVPIEAAWGDVDAGFSEADEVIEGNYFAQNTWMAALENHGNVVLWDPDDNLTIHTGTQSPFDNRTVWASGLGLPVNKVRIIQHQMGGGFGGKSYHMRHHGLAALLSKKTGKPIKFEGWKEDEFTRCNTRHSFKFNIKTGVKNDGTLTACQVTNYQNAGAYFTDTLGVGFVAMAMLDMYPFPNASWTGYPVYTNCPTAGAYRGYGGLQSQYASEQHVDRMCEAIGMDPIEFRKKNHIRSGDPFGFGQVLGSEALDECLDKGAVAIGWMDKWKGFGIPYFSEGSKRRAVGFATGIHVGVYGLDVVVVKLQEDGSAQVLTGIADAGQGPTTVISMVCAEALKIPYEKVSIILSDTAAVPWASATVASRGAATAGKATQLACEDALSQLFEAAAVLLEVDVESLDASDSEIFVKTNPSLKVMYSEVLETVFPAVIIGVGRWGAPADYAMQGFAANFVDLEVDVDTGEVKLLKIAAAHDVGKALNKNTCENQIEGGICSQGIGMALWEDFVADKATGKILNTNYIDFAVPTSLEAPDEFETILVEPWEERGPFGAKGCSEIALVPIGAAIANTIYNAIGVRITEYPIDPRKILTALGKV